MENVFDLDAKVPEIDSLPGLGKNIFHRTFLRCAIVSSASDTDNLVGCISGNYDC